MEAGKGNTVPRVAVQSRDQAFAQMVNVNDSINVMTTLLLTYYNTKNMSTIACYGGRSGSRHGRSAARAATPGR